MGGYILLWVAALVGICLVAMMFMASRYKRCPSNMIMVKYGKVAQGASAQCYHGGATFVYPLIQDYSFLSLTPMTISIPLQGALSFQNIRIHVPSTFTVAISIEPCVLHNAA